MDAPSSVPATSFITRIASFAVQRGRIVLGAWLAVAALGLTAYFGGLAREGFPPVNLPLAVVTGTYFVDDPELTDADIAIALTERYSEVEGVDTVQSFSQPNNFALVVQFEDDFSSEDGAALLSAANGNELIPAEATLDVRALNPTKFVEEFDVIVAIRGPEGATPEDLEAEAAALSTFLQEDGSIERATVRNLLTEGVNPVTGTDEIRQTRFTRVATSGDSAFDESITLGLVRNDAAGLDILGFSDAVTARLQADPPLSDGYDAEITADFATDIRSQLSNLTGNMITGLIAVAIVSLLLIGWRVSLITAGFMATVLLASLAGLWFLGYSLNTITLFGLILTLGLLVDDAIVISESIDANREEANEPLGVVRTAINRVGSASFAGTLTTVLVFAPMLFVSGILGEFIRAIPATVILTLLLSFLFSIVFIPGIARPFLLRSKAPDNAIIRGEKAAARALGRLASYPEGNGPKGWLVGLLLVATSLVLIAGSFVIAAGLKFNIFPPTKDGNAALVTIDFPFGTTLEQAQSISAEADNIVLDVLGEDLLRSQYIRGNERTVVAFIDLVPFNTRDTTSPEYVSRLEERFAAIDNARITVAPVENGPPVDDFPFAAQISVPADVDVAISEQLAADLQAALNGADLDKTSGEPASITGTINSTEGQVVRTDGVRQIEVRAAFSNDDLTNNLNAAEALVADQFDAGELESRGLPSDAIAFDFGQESDNQEDFASLGRALMIALVLMLLLLMLQFRSFVQPILVFLAIPFSFFGLFSILRLTDNPISFFVNVGLIALVGVVVNNSILLVDAANQARRDGLSPGAAIGQSVTRRFRPLVATTITTVVGLLPLALSDPFWEALSFTLIGGLVSSTFLVLLAFPVFYMVIEKVRTRVRNVARKLLGWDLIT